MYVVDGKDRAVRLEKIPRRDPNTPVPVLRADDHRLVLAYVADAREPREGGFDRARGVAVPGGAVAVVEFEDVTSHMFGFPNDAVWTGHPLWRRGLNDVGAFAFEVLDSSWIRALNRIESVHSRPLDFFGSKRHFILPFGDTTFECVAGGFHALIREGSPGQALDDVWRSGPGRAA